jgi:hypothetical protein
MMLDVQFLRASIFAGLLLTASCGSSPESATKPSTPASTASSARITQFYSPTPVAPKGEKGMLCYGVENAARVRLDPPEVEIAPSFSRCIDVFPKQTTTYTLIAEGKDGKEARQSVEIRRGAARVQIREIVVSKLEVARGQSVDVCVDAPGASAFNVSPSGRVLPNLPPSKGCVRDTPSKTTTYTVSVTGPSGESDEGQVTVRVK